MDEGFDCESETIVSSAIPLLLSTHNNILCSVKKFITTLEKCNELSWDGTKGLSLLDLKTDTMLTYMINITYLILKKNCGQSIEDPETRQRIAHMRTVLEKIKPLEEKLKYQIDKMVKSVVSGPKGGTDKSSFRANLKDLDSSTSEEESQIQDFANNKDAESNISTKKVGVYRPPKLAAVPYNDESKVEKQQKLLENAKKRALSTSMMQELKEEYLDTPLEITSSTTLRNMQTKYRKERESYEETYFTRIPQTKKEKHRDKLMSLLTVGTLGTEITRFENISALENRLSSNLKKRKKSLLKYKRKNGFKRRKMM